MGIKAEFALHGATLRNVMWSVSAWRPDGILVVCDWAHHYKPSGTPGVAHYEDRLSRWRGPGNRELRRNLELAVANGSSLRLVLATATRAEDIPRIEAGYDDEAGGTVLDIPKKHHAAMGQLGSVAEFDGDRFVYRFRRHTVPAGGEQMMLP